MSSHLQNLLGHKPSVLVVDDDEDLLLVLQLALVAEGFHVIKSVNGKYVFELIASELPDILLVDITMDGIDGRDICRQIKSNPVTVKLPVLFFSANRNLAEIALSCGAEGFVNKPVEVKQLAKTLSSVITDQID